MLREYKATITTDGSQNAEVYVGSRIVGRIVAIKYEPGDIATGADLTITGSETGVPVLTKENAGTSDVWYYPVAAANEVADGSASSLRECPVYLYQERMKVAVAQGGATKTGEITLYVDEELP
jgi:hypothetical protein